MSNLPFIVYSKPNKHICFVLCLFVLMFVGCHAHAAKSPVSLGGQRHMFIDDMLISKMNNVTFQAHPPEVRRGVFQSDKPWENISEYSCVIDDGKEYKMYYGNTGKHPNVCLATSKDGVNWVKPMLGLHDFNGSKENNIVIDADGNGSMYYDLHDPDPSRRYKYFTCQIADDKPGTKTTEGMVIHTSPDGIHFTKSEVQLLPFNSDSQAVMFWDPYISKYVCYFRGVSDRGRVVVRDETDDPMKPWPYKQIEHPYYNDHEIPYVTSQLPNVLTSDDNDPPDSDLYGNQVFLYPWAYKVYLAFPTCYYHYKGEREFLSPIGPGNVGVGEVQIAASRDGMNWTRYRRPAYIKHGWYPDDHYCYWPWAFQGMVRKDNKIMQWVRLRTTTHGGGKFMKGGKSRFGDVALFEQQIDRFVGAEFNYTGGSITTKPFTFEGNRLSLNADTGAMGEGRVAILDAYGKPIPGFEMKDCDIVSGDWLDKIVSWSHGKNDVSSLAGKTIRLQFDMRGATLYAFQFVNAQAP